MRDAGAVARRANGVFAIENKKSPRDRACAPVACPFGNRIQGVDMSLRKNRSRAAVMSAVLCGLLHCFSANAGDAIVAASTQEARVAEQRPANYSIDLSKSPSRQFTIDTLDAQGNFLGGLILPGLDLMHRALARDTAGLPFANGHYSPLPRCTDDAIVSGAIEAQAGAIERAFARLAATDGHCLLSGGNAALLAAHLSVPCQVFENLPLEGLRQLATEN